MNEDVLFYIYFLMLFNFTVIIRFFFFRRYFYRKILLHYNYEYACINDTYAMCVRSGVGDQ